MATVKLIVDGGGMKPGPTVAQQLGPMGINLGKVIEETNKATSSFKGMKVPVEINVNAKTKQFEIIVFSPPVSELIKKELKIEKGSGRPKDTKIGNLAIEQVISIAKTKLPNMLAKDLKAAVRLVIGSCVSLGVLVESKDSKETMRDVSEGLYDTEISEEKTSVSPERKIELERFFVEVRSKQEAKAKAEAEATAAAAAAASVEGEKPEAKAEAKKEEKTEEKKPAVEKKEEKPEKKQEKKESKK